MGGSKSLDCLLLLPFLPLEIHGCSVVGLNFFGFFSSPPCQCNFVKSKLRVLISNNTHVVRCRGVLGRSGAGAPWALCPGAGRAASRAAAGEEGRGAAVAIALMSGAPANVWLVPLPFRSLPLARGARRGRRDSHIFQREERSQRSRLIRTCVRCPRPTKAAFKRETQCYLMSCEMRRCC